MPVHSVAAAQAWRKEHCDPDRVKSAPVAPADAAPVDPTYAETKLRLLTAEVLLREERARNAGGVTLPSIRVEREFRVGLRLLRPSI